MSELIQCKRTQMSETREVTEKDFRIYKMERSIPCVTGSSYNVSISDVDKINGSPKIGDMIARNPKNNLDQWLIAKEYFEDNFEII